MAKPNGIYMPTFDMEDIGKQCYSHLNVTLAALNRQYERYRKGSIDGGKRSMCEKANEFIEPISSELRARELAKG